MRRTYSGGTAGPFSRITTSTACARAHPERGHSCQTLLSVATPERPLISAVPTLHLQALLRTGTSASAWRQYQNVPVAFLPSSQSELMLTNRALPCYTATVNSYW